MFSFLFKLAHHQGRLSTHTVTKTPHKALPTRIVVFLLAVFPHMNSWQTVHRTRGGAYIPATACPAGANTFVTVMSGTLEVLVYSPADGLPCLRPTFGIAPCPPPSSPWDEREHKESRSDVDGNTKEDELPKRQSFLDDVNSVEEREVANLMSPKPNPRVLLEEALGLKGGSMGHEDHSPARKRRIIVDRTEGDNTGNTKRKVTNGNVEEKEAGATDNPSDNNRERSSSSPESFYWPHEPRYCANVWQKYDSRDGGTVARFVHDPSPIFMPRPNFSHGAANTDKSRQVRARGF